MGRAVVLFEESSQEHAGSNGSIEDDDAVPANVIVYGPGGETDIEQYKGFTMTSNPKKFGPIAEGEYEGRSNGAKKGKLPSNLYIFSTKATALAKEQGYGPRLCCFISGNVRNTNPDIKGAWNYNTIYKDGIYIHSTGCNGKLGTRNSTGCLLISDKDWGRFKNQLVGVTSFKVLLHRLYSE